MKLNNKGFTFVEILAVIVIIGLLTGISIAAFSKYKENAIKNDYEALARSSYNAMEEYMMSHPYDNKVSLETLENENLLSNRKDPASKDKDCTGTVEVAKNNGSNGKLDDGTYQVHLCCVSIQKTYTYPGGKSIDLEDTSNCDYVPEEEPPAGKYILRYNDNKGTGCSTKSITKNAGEAWGTLCTPTRSGYKFVDWNYGTETITSSSIAERNITVKAEWKSTATKKYTLKYDDNGGSGCSSKTITKNENEAWGTLCTPSRTGYTFDDWYDESSKVTNTTKATKNVTVKAKWKVKQFTITIKKDSKINLIKIDGANVTSKKVNYGTKVTVDVGAIDYYHPKWTVDNSTAKSRTFTVTKDITYEVISGENTITVNYYANGGSLAPNPSQRCPIKAGCSHSECVWKEGWTEESGCKSKTDHVKILTVPYNGDGYSKEKKGMPNYDTTYSALFMTRSGCTGTNYWHIGSATSSNKINENTDFFPHMSDFANDKRVNKGKDLKKGNVTVDVYAGWNCPKSIKCAAGNYLPKNKTTCAKCTKGNYCEGGIFFKSTSANQGIKACPTAYPNSNAGSSKITNCYMKVKAGNYIATAQATKVTKCPKNTYRVAHTVHFKSTSSCGNCPSGYPNSNEGSTAATKCYRTNTATFTYLKGAESWNGYNKTKVPLTCNQYNGQANCQVTAPNHIDIPGQSHCGKKYNTLIINKGWNKTKNSATGGIGTGKKINITGNVTYYSVYLPNSNYIEKITALKVDGADNSHLSIGGTTDGKTCGKGTPNIYNRNQPIEDGFNTYHSYTLENAYIYWSGTWLVNTEDKPYDENYLYIVGKPMNSKGKNSKADKVCKQWKSLTDHTNVFDDCPSSAYIKALQLTW